LAAAALAAAASAASAFAASAASPSRCSGQAGGPVQCVRREGAWDARQSVTRLQGRSHAAAQTLSMAGWLLRQRLSAAHTCRKGIQGASSGPCLYPSRLQQHTRGAARGVVTRAQQGTTAVCATGRPHPSAG
jgi:hypothetical protein